MGARQMQAATTDMMVAERYFAVGPAMTELRLMDWRPMAVLRPALMGSLRLSMGAGVGAGFGAVSGHYGLWIAAGMVLGAALNAVSAPPAQVARVARTSAAEGPYRIH